MGPWLVDIESFERLSQDVISRRLVLQLAQLSREGRLEPFVGCVTDDPDLDDATRAAIAELAHDETFLLAAEDYLARTQVVH
ncbi:MAG TPA: hypothetical protein VFA24_07190 [Gaiellaceae bacterium]|nr:hypothetical protein [Gaiellaceae bacterium]